MDRMDRFHFVKWLGNLLYCPEIFMNAQTQNFLDYPQKRPFGILKNSALWRIFVISTAPLFHFVWEFGVNFREKILYLASDHRGEMRPALRKRCLEILKDDPNLTRYAHELRAQISEELLQKNRVVLLMNSSPEAFSASLENQLSLNARLGLLRFALASEQLDVVLPYFGVVPRLNSISVMFNIVRPELKEEGSKSWHFDDGYYKSLNLFLCVSDLTDTNGPYSALGTEVCPHHATIPLDFIDRSQPLWLNQRHSDELLFRYVPRSAAQKMTGPAGTAAWVDSSAVYHKGGHCKTSERLMLQNHYSTELGASQPSVLKQLGLEGNPEAEALVNTAVKRYMVHGTQNSITHRIAMKLKNPVYFMGRRILCYYLKPL